MKHLPKYESSKTPKSLLVGKLIKPEKLIVGWREWCGFPKLHLPAIKAKIDTGAKTSALHAWEVEPFRRQGELYVHFIVHPIQRDQNYIVECSAKVVDQRIVINSAGHKQLRYVIKTPLTLGDYTWDIELTLTNRDEMAFRMLLGRDALKGHAIVDPQRSLCQGNIKKRQLQLLYS